MPGVAVGAAPAGGVVPVTGGVSRSPSPARHHDFQRAERGRRRPGSVLSGRVDYAQGERTLSLADVPAQAVHARKEVLRTLHPDVLGVGKPDWATSTVVESNGPGVQHARALQRTLHQHEPFRVAVNYRAEVLPRDNGYVPTRKSKLQFDDTLLMSQEERERRRSSPTLVRRVEIPVHPALEGKPQWDCTTSPDAKLNHARLSVIDERTVRWQQQRQRAQQRSRSAAPSVAGMRRGVGFADVDENAADENAGERSAYASASASANANAGAAPLSLVERERIRMREMRDAKLAMREENSRRAAFAQAAVHVPTAADRAAGEVSAQKQRELRAQMRGTMQKSRVRHEYWHPGTFSDNPVAGKRAAWSCCMAESRAARGCEHRAVDLDKWNFASY